MFQTKHGSEIVLFYLMDSKKLSLAYIVLKGGKVYRKPRISSMTEYKAFDSEFLIKKSLIDNFNLIIY